MSQSDSLNAPPPRFWRDDGLPFIEAQAVQDGRQVCYGRHSHEIFSIGSIMTGHSHYFHEKKRQQISAGTVVLMNPGDVHACSALDKQPWGYRMLYVDTAWLARLQHESGLDPNVDFHGFSIISTPSPALFAGLNQLYDVLVDPDADNLLKHSVALSFFLDVQHTLAVTPTGPRTSSQKLRRAADYINDNFSRAIKLEDICKAANLSESYLIRSFEQVYRMTPHAYLLNRRIQYAREQLKRGRLIAEVALETGFADQAHFQRTFKKYLAITPGQYRQ
jgi:AraC-like DNA-binding protein